MTKTSVPTDWHANFSLQHNSGTRKIDVTFEFIFCLFCHIEDSQARKMNLRSVDQVDKGTMNGRCSPCTSNQH
jgi:hypothetical protein